MVAELASAHAAERGLRPDEVRRLLQRATGIKWRRPAYLHFRRLDSLCATEHTLVLSVRHPQSLFARLWTLFKRLWKREMQHCIAVRGGRIYDPQFPDIHSIDDYPNASWIPTIVYRPVDVNQLDAVQRHNDEHFRKDRLWSEILNS